MMTSIIAFIIVLGVLIFFHELGHFLVAKLFGVGVEIFSLGFGPRIFGKKVDRTDYRLSAIPLGGYVKMVGEEPDEVLPEEDIPFSFNHKHVLKRALIVAAGPFFNLVLAILIFFTIFQIYGLPIIKPVVGKVEDGGPAFKAGIKKGDFIVSIDDLPVNTWDDMAKLISKSNGKSLKFTLKREGELKNISITPEVISTKNLFNETVNRYVVKITSSGDSITKDLNIIEAFTESIKQAYNISELTLISIVKLVQGIIPSKTIGGPIFIAQMAGEQAKVGIANLAFFIALISINLAILNFLPIPVLDGGHIFFFLIEAVIRKPVNLKVREIAQQVGMVLLFLLMVYAFYNDITRTFSTQ
ncbi:MAG: RIP metalloprotease RseP [Desulfobacterales bacterium]|nr:RIP metalloprotease RseP [Desulfobacterales bacterium]